jgi:hypothetical protein
MRIGRRTGSSKGDSPYAMPCYRMGCRTSDTNDLLCDRVDISRTAGPEYMLFFLAVNV